MTTFVDTNVLLDVATNDRQWANWSIQSLEAAAIRGSLAINGIVYAEFSVRYPRIEDVDAFVDAAGMSRCLARRCFWRVRRSRNTARTTVSEPACCQIFSSARMQPCLARPCSRATPHAIGRTFQSCA
jgi:hypothetical protein